MWGNIRSASSHIPIDPSIANRQQRKVKMETPSKVKEIPWGTEVQDITDGFKGIVTSRTEYWNGCVQYYVQPPVDKKTGEAMKGYGIDVQYLKIIGPGCSKKYPQNETVAPLKPAEPGGPRRDKIESKP